MDEAAKAVDAALADEPDDATYLALRGVVDLATGKTEDAEANLSLAVDVTTDDKSDVGKVADLMSAAATDLAQAVDACRQSYLDAPCGAEELAAGDIDAALAAIATSVNAAYVGDAQHPFTLIGVGALP
jgi:hypothetical protein